MPPQQEVCGGAAGGRRDPSRPSDLNFAGPSQSQDPAFPSSPLSALGSPHRSPYAQMPGTPRPDYSQQTSDPFTQQSPPYVNPQTPGTPRPHSDPSYMVAVPALRLEQYSQQPPGAGHRPSPSHQNTDPYSSSPGTPRPPVAERFPRSPGSQRSGEASSSRTLRADQYSQQSAAVRAQNPPADGFAPQHGGAAASPLASESFSAAQHQVALGVGPGSALLSGGCSASLCSLLPPFLCSCLQGNSICWTLFLEAPSARSKSTLACLRPAASLDWRFNQVQTLLSRAPWFQALPMQTRPSPATWHRWTWLP